MIKSVKIENYKSIQELEVDVGRFNVIIGENGAGKSNFLEGIAIFSAGTLHAQLTGSREDG